MPERPLDSVSQHGVLENADPLDLELDCVEKELGDEHAAQLAGLLDAAGIEADPADFRRYGSARQLYNFKIDNAGAY